MLIHIVAAYAVLSCCMFVPLGLLVFFMGIFERVNKADRLGENYLAFTSFVSFTYTLLQFLPVLVFIQFYIVARERSSKM